MNNNRNSRSGKSNFRPGNKPQGAPKSSKPGGFNRFDKPERKDKPYKNAKFDRKPAPEGKNPKFERFDKPERRYDKPEKRFDKPERRFDKPENKFKRPERKFEKKPVNEARTPEAAVPKVEQEDSGMVYGRNAVIELLKSGRPIDKLYVQSGQREGSITKIFSEAVKKGIPVIETEKIKLDSMLNNSSHQGVIALASEKDYCSVDDILDIAKQRKEKPFILIADKIMDPHNLGAIIRTAECAGVHGIIIPKRNAAGVSPIVTKTSAGASIYMAIAKVANIASTIEELKNKNIWVFASVSDADAVSEADDERFKSYDDADYDAPMAIVVGNEGEGLSPIVLQKSDFLVKIPMLGEIKSLNVSCASAVLIYEASRQRKRNLK